MFSPKKSLIPPDMALGVDPEKFLLGEKMYLDVKNLFETDPDITTAKTVKYLVEKYSNEFEPKMIAWVCLVVGKEWDNWVFDKAMNNVFGINPENE